MKEKKNRKLIGPVLVFVLVLVIDIALRMSMDIYQNRGVSFGVYFPGVNILTVVVWVAVLVRLIKQPNWGLWLVVVGGGINLGQKIFLGYVADYFRMFGVYNNLADLVIFVGIIWYILDDGRHRHSLQ